MIKAHKRINYVDMKIIPKVLHWWRSKNRCQPYSHSSSDQSRLVFLAPFVTTGLRIFTTFIWLYMSLPFVINLVDNHVCNLAGIGVLVYSWLPYAQEDLNEQKERLRDAWPISNPPASSSYYSTSTLNVKSMNDVASLSLDSLSLNTKTSPHSAIFPPPTSTSFSPTNHVYAASAAPAYSYLRKSFYQCQSGIETFQKGKEKTST
nr:hypothetical transcript [Hymenolepis microstoma]